MDVRLNKSGKDCAAWGIDNFVSVPGILGSDCRDASVTNQKIAAHDGILGIHRHNRAALDQNRFSHENAARLSHKKESAVGAKYFIEQPSL